MSLRPKKGTRRKTRIHTVGNTEYQNALKMINALTTPNLIRLSEGDTPLDFGRGDEAGQAIADMEDPSLLQHAAENEIARRRMRAQQGETPIRDPITVIKGSIEGIVFVFKGDVRKSLATSNRMNIRRYDEKGDLHESEMLIQSDYDQEALMGYMDVIQAEDFLGGYAVIMDDPGYL